MRIAILGLAVLAVSLPSAARPAAPDERSDTSDATVHASPEVGDFAARALEASPRMRAARAALEAGRAFETAAAQPLYNPELEADYEDATDRTWEVGLGQTLDWAGKREARTSVAAAERRALAAEYLAERREFLAGLLTGLGAYQTDVQRVDLALERVRVMEDFADLARRRFETGDINQVEADLAALAALDARIQRATAGADLAEAVQSVRSLVTGVPVTHWPAMEMELPVVEPVDEPRSLVLALPEVQAAQRRAEAADAVVELRQLQRKPDPTLSLRGGQEADETLLGVNLSIPLFIRNSFAAEVAAAAAERDRAQQIADDLYRHSYARFEGALERYRLVRDAWLSWEKTGRPSLNSQIDVLRRLWEAGEISTTDYLVQLRQTLDTRENALDLQLSQWRAWFEWLAASGQIDAWLNLEDPS